MRVIRPIARILLTIDVVQVVPPELRMAASRACGERARSRQGPDVCADVIVATAPELSSLVLQEQGSDAIVAVDMAATGLDLTQLECLPAAQA